MTNRILFSIFLLIALSCDFNQAKSGGEATSSTQDTIVLFDRGRFSECSEATRRAFSINLFSPFVVSSAISKGAGLVYRKRYIREDSVSVTLLFENINIYEEDMLFRNSEGLGSNVVFLDTIIIDGDRILAKSIGVEESKASINYVIFDSIGYLHLNILDERHLIFQEKIADGEKILSSITDVKCYDPSTYIVGNANKVNEHLNKFDWCLEHQCHLINSDEAHKHEEVIVLVNEDDFSTSVEIDIAATCIVMAYDFAKKYKLISFVEKSDSLTVFNRLAQFSINQCLSEIPEECEFYNLVDCTWLKSSLQKKIFDPITCGKLSNSSK